MNIISVIITNPMYKSLAFAPVLLGFVLQDGSREPYKDRYLNKLQSLSTTCLLLVLICNMFSAVSIIVDVTTTPNIYLVVQILSIIEMVLYATVPMSLPVWKIYNYISSRRNKDKKTQ